MKSTLPLLSLVIAFACVNRARGETPREFLQHYLPEGQKLRQSYERARIIARVEETLQGKVGVYELERFQDGDKIKLVRRYVSGDKLYARTEMTAHVATPDTSFTVQKNAALSPYNLAFHGKAPSDYEAVTRQINLVGSSLLESPYSCIQMPLDRLLAMKETSIEKIEEEKQDDVLLKRVHLRIAPFNEGLRKRIDRLEGWLLFEADRHWVLRQFDIAYWDKDKKLNSRMTGSMRYGQAADGIPMLREADYEFLDAKGTSARKYQALVKELDFGPIAAKEFQLTAWGFPESKFDGTKRRNLGLILSVTIAVLALILIIIVRRWKTKRQQ